VRAVIANPLTMIASDGFDVKPRQGHPRSAGTYSRVLGRYVREQQTLSLMQALRKMTLMPAQRLERLFRGREQSHGSRQSQDRRD